MSESDFEEWRRHLATETRTNSRESEPLIVLDVPGLTLLAHPDPDRVGEEAIWPNLAASSETGSEVAGLSRLEPGFVPLGGGEKRPLADPHLSRQPILLRRTEEGISLDASHTRTKLKVDGESITGRIQISATALKRGIVLLVGRRIALLLHLLRPLTDRPPDFGLVGQSAALLRLRREINRVADLMLPVLLRGESGTGKELVSRALVHHGPNPGGPFLSLNMAAIPPSLAAAELFGASRGAFSGADRARTGYFERADGGTLFLDEIGETPLEVQALLLRVLESGEIQPLGSDTPRKISVRLIAATDADLEQASAEGRFKAPLLHRLGGYEIRLPPLRERRDDIGRLFFHLLKHELEALGETWKLTSSGPFGRPWVDAGLVARLATYDWPGNVRQLRNVVRQLVVAHRGLSEMSMTEQVAELVGSKRRPTLGQATTATSTGKGRPSPILNPLKSARPTASTYRDPTEVGEEALLHHLRANRFELKPTAEDLGISRASLYALIERCPKVRKAGDLGRQEIEACSRSHDGNIIAMATELEVSKQGLKRRMKELGLR